MAKKSMKFNDAAQAKSVIETKKEELATAQKERRQFEKSNELKKGEDHSDHEKHGKKWGKMKKNEEAIEAEINEAKEWLKENKPAKEKKQRVLKYDYPADCVTDEDKKKFRTRMRNAANKKEGAAEGKKAKKEAKPSEEETSSKKKSKKDKKKNKKSED